MAVNEIETVSKEVEDGEVGKELFKGLVEMFQQRGRSGRVEQKNTNKNKKAKQKMIKKSRIDNRRKKH